MTGFENGVKIQLIGFIYTPGVTSFVKNSSSCLVMI